MPTRNPYIDALDRARSAAGTVKGSWVVAVAVLLYLLALTLAHPVVDVDLFTRAAVGRLTAQLGTAPSVDPFSFAPKNPVWYDHEWFIAWIIFEIAAHLGDAGLILLQAAFTIATFCVIRLAQLRFFPTRPGLSILVLAASVPSLDYIWFTTVRAHVVTYLCYSFYLLAFVTARSDRRYRLLALLPAVQVLWVNSHGGFVVGIAFAAIYAICSLIDQPREAKAFALIVAAGCALAPLLNPYGFGFLNFIFNAVTQRPYEITEWARSSPADMKGLWFYGLALVLLLGAALRGYRKVPWEGRFFLLLSFRYGAEHERLTPLFTIAAIIYGLPLIEAVELRIRRYSSRVAIAAERIFIGAAVFITIVSLVPISKTVGRIVQGNFSLDDLTSPIAATEWLWNSGYSGRVLTHYNDGSYALWKLYPRFQISFDGRYDGVYPPRIRELGFAAFRPNDPLQSEAMSVFQPDFILVGFSTSALCKPENADRIRAFPGFENIYSDEKSCVLGRSTVVRSLPANTQVPPRPAWIAW